MESSPEVSNGRRPKVAVFSTNFLAYSQTFIYEQLRHHRRYEPEVFCWRRHNPGRFPFEPVHHANLLYGGTCYDRSFHRRFAEAGFSVVHAHFGPGAIYARPYARRHDLPLVVTFHGYDVPLLWNNRRLTPEYWPYLFGAPKMLRAMTLGLCASNELRSLLVEQGVPREKLRVCRLGVDLSQWAPVEKSRGPLRVVMVGRFVEKKGHRYAIEAFAEHRQSHPGATFRLLGDGDLMEECEALARSFGLGDDAIQFLGAKPSSVVREELDRAHVLLAPSLIGRDGDRESGLIVAKEASACGVVVVGTFHGGIPEIVDHGVTGLLAPERNAAMLADHLATLAAEPERREEMASAAVAKMHAEYSVVDRIADLEERYDEARTLHRRGR